MNWDKACQILDVVLVNTCKMNSMDLPDNCEVDDIRHTIHQALEEGLSAKEAYKAGVEAIETEYGGAEAFLQTLMFG